MEMIYKQFIKKSIYIFLLQLLPTDLSKVLTLLSVISLKQ